MTSELPSTMKAVVLKGPFEVAIEERPVPRVKSPTDAILKVLQSGLCGSDLHYYRGHQPPPYGFILGHEVVGLVAEVGDEVKKFKVGDLVVSAFSTSCGDCMYCDKQYSSRCLSSQNIGTTILDGAQAEYFRLPLADTTLYHAPTDLPKELVVLMTDILPTGYQVAYHAKTLLLSDQPARTEADIHKKSGVCVVIGCGPVGLCAITSACTLFETVYATDIATHRLEAAERHGAIALPLDKLKEEVTRVTKGLGVDACLEVVGHASALMTALELIRPYGAISSCGVHTHDLAIPGSMLYAKNVRMQFGRCAVRKYFDRALDLLRQNQALFSTFIEHRIGFDQAAEYYTLFEQNKVAKTVFDLQ